MKHRNDQTVCIAYPYATHQSSRFAHSKDLVLMRDATGRRRIQSFAFNSSGANITNARNEIVAQFLDGTDCDYLWFVDTDMSFDDDILERLIATAHPVDRPIVGALCFSLQDGYRACPTLYVIRGDDKVGRVMDYPENTVMRVLTGTGCLLIHRTVLEAMRERCFNPAYLWFQETNLGDLPIGEDLTFCLRAEGLGFPVHVDTSVECGHEKTLIVDSAMYRAQRAAKVLEHADPIFPTYAVIPSRNRAEMLANLRAQLEPQTAQVFVMDNGYDPPPPDAHPCHDWPLHKMWNRGLDHAARWAFSPYNVLIVNDDVEVAPDLVARLEAALRADDDNWVAFPNDGGRPTGWCFMLRGEAGLRVDERFEWWYGDTDLFRQVTEQGKRCVVAEDAHAIHLDPMTSTLSDPERLAQAEADEKLYADKWGIDPDTLWLAKNRSRL